MYLFDIDGTLTHVHGEIEEKTGYTSYAFWDLLTYAFAIDETSIREEIRLWNESMKEETDPTGSSHNMMQKAIYLLRPDVTGSHLKEKARDITEKFIEAGVLRTSAINLLKKLIEADEFCILSTGSYSEGAFGFVEALIDKGLLPKDSLMKLVISGAEIDWNTRKLLHANIRERKADGLRRVLEASGHIKIGDPLPIVKAVFCDDPEINDKGIFELAPVDSRFVIDTVKRRERLLSLNIKLYTWKTIIDSFSTASPVIFLDHIAVSNSDLKKNLARGKQP